MNFANNGWSGTGPCEVFVLGKPTWPHVQVRRTWIIASAKSPKVTISVAIALFVLLSSAFAQNGTVQATIPFAFTVRKQTGDEQFVAFSINPAGKGSAAEVGYARTTKPEEAMVLASRLDKKQLQREQLAERGPSG